MLPAVRREALLQDAPGRAGEQIAHPVAVRVAPQRLLALHRGEQRPRVHRMIERQTVPPQDDMPLKDASELH